MGASWTELDTIAQLSVGMTVTPGEEPGMHSLSVCVYAGGCFVSEFDPALLQADGNRVLALEHRFIGDDYCVYERFLSSNATISMRSTPSAVFWSNDDFDLSSKTVRMSRASELNRDKERVQTIRFSSNFKSDMTVFMGGINTGLLVSRNKGRHFNMVWSADNTMVSEIRLSPDYATDNTIAVLVEAPPESGNRHSKVFVSTQGGDPGTFKRLKSSRSQYMNLAILSGPKSSSGLTIILVREDGKVFVNTRGLDGVVRLVLPAEELSGGVG